MGSDLLPRRSAVLAVGVALALSVGGAHAAGAASGQVVNPGFEKDADGDGLPDGWAFIDGDGGKAALSLDKGHEGGRCAKLVCQEREGRWGPGLGQTGTVAVERGKHYRVSFWARGEDLTTIYVGLHDTANWKHCGLWNRVALSEDWRRCEVVFCASKACSATTRLQFGTSHEGTFWVDDVAFEPSGPPRNEAVIDAKGATNLVPNASFELGAAGWGTWGADKLFGQVDTTTAVHGACSFRIALAPDLYPVYYNDYTYRLHGTPSHAPVTSLPLANIGWLPLVEGQPYTLSVWLKTDRPGLAVRATVRQWPGKVASKAFAATAGWQRHGFTFEATRESGFVALGAELADPARDRATLWIDGIQLQQGREATAFEPMRAVEIAALTDRPGNIFHLGDDVALALRIFNNTGRARQVSWEERITDFHGREVHRAAVSMQAPPLATKRRLVPPVAEPGFYRLHLRLQGDGTVQDRQMRFAVIFPYARTHPNADSQFGINHAFVSDHFMRLAQDAGVGWVRSWFAKWDDVERQKGQFGFSEPDLQLSRLLKLGVRVEVCLATPSSRWASSAPADLGGTTGSEAERRRNWWLPTSFDDYENYVFRVVGHFKDRVKHWEVFNEPTDRKGGPQSNLDLKTHYIRFLRRARAGARRADPKCQVLGAGHHYVSHAMEKQNALASMDIISEHAYPGLAGSPSWQRRWDALGTKFRAAGGPRPIWMTEYGIYADDDPDPTTANSRFLVHLGTASEREAATHVVQHYVVALASGVEKVFFHIGNWPWWVNHEHGCGFHMFFEYGGVPRKTYVAHNVLAWMLSPTGRFHRRIAAGPRLFAYEFRSRGKATIVAWRTKPMALDARARAALCAEGVEVRDIAGRDVRGGLTRLAKSPVYFRTHARHAERLAQALAGLAEAGR